MHLWTLTKWEKYYQQADTVRSGLRLRTEKDVDPEVKRDCKAFCRWLRANYCFPIRVPVYLKATEFIRARDDELVSATFFEPFNRWDEPYIRVAAGDYEKLLRQRGKDNAVAAILCSIAHELTHYFQWINDMELTETGAERQARMYAGYIVDEYAETREHP